MKSSGNFIKIVVHNPDAAVNEGPIILKGTGPFAGKVYQTCLNAIDFLSL